MAIPALDRGLSALRLTPNLTKLNVTHSKTKITFFRKISEDTVLSDLFLNILLKFTFQNIDITLKLLQTNEIRKGHVIKKHLALEFNEN